MLSSYWLCLYFFMIVHHSETKQSKLLIISFDGFSYKYLNNSFTPYLNSLKNISVTTPFLLNIFPTQTFPNHFSIATGLYSETHGVLGSSYYDPRQKKVLHYSDPVMWHYNNKVIPLWTLNEIQGGHSGVMMWPGGEFMYNGIRTTRINPFILDMTWKNRVNAMFGWFNDTKIPINLGFLYFEEPDYLIHAYGPDSIHTREQVSKVDEIAKYIRDKFKSIDDLNIVFLSDHGISGVYERNIINVSSVCGPDCSMYGTSPVRHVYSKGDINEAYMKLKTFSRSNGNFDVYLKSDIPERLHFKDCSLIPPVLLIAKPGYAFDDLYKSIEWYKKTFENISDNQQFGVHGYEPNDPKMHAFFMASGPAFKKNFSIQPFRNIDLYPLFARILDLQLPAMPLNGTVNNVQNMLVEEWLSANKNISQFVYYLLDSAIFMFLLCTIVAVGIYCKNVWKRRKINQMWLSVGNEEKSLIYYNSDSDEEIDLFRI